MSRSRGRVFPSRRDDNLFTHSGLELGHIALLSLFTGDEIPFTHSFPGTTMFFSNFTGKEHSWREDDAVHVCTRVWVNAPRATDALCGAHGTARAHHITGPSNC